MWLIIHIQTAYYGYSNSYNNQSYNNSGYSSYSNSSSTTSAQLKNYAKGEIPASLFSKLSDTLSVANVREALEIPSTVEELKNWDPKKLEGSNKAENKMVEEAKKELCSLLNEKGQKYFCEEHKTTVDTLASGTFKEAKNIVFKNLQQLIQSAIKDITQKLSMTEQSSSQIERNRTVRERNILQSETRTLQEIQRLNKVEQSYKKQIEESKTTPEDRDFYQKSLEVVERQKALLQNEPKQEEKALEEEKKRLEQLKSEKESMKKDLEHLKQLAEKIAAKLHGHTDSAESLKNSWDETNKYFQEEAKAVEEDKRRKQEEKRKEETEAKKEQQEEETADKKVLALIKGEENKMGIKDPSSKEEQNIFGLIGKIFK